MPTSASTNDLSLAARAQKIAASVKAYQATMKKIAAKKQDIVNRAKSAVVEQDQDKIADLQRAIAGKK